MLLDYNEPLEYLYEGIDFSTITSTDFSLLPMLSNYYNYWRRRRPATKDAIAECEKNHSYIVSDTSRFLKRFVEDVHITDDEYDYTLVTPNYSKINFRVEVFYKMQSKVSEDYYFYIDYFLYREALVKHVDDLHARMTFIMDNQENYYKDRT